MNIWTVDIETNGLELEEITAIHCVVAREYATGKVVVWDNTKSSEELLGILNGARIIGHNFIAYDLPVLKRFFGDSLNLSYTKVIDTCLLSRMLYPDFEMHPNCPTSRGLPGKKKRIGQHSLENWGFYLGMGKIEH